MKKILLSLLTMALVSSAVYAATSAQFSDTETSTGNTFTAGTLDLKVNGADEVAHITLADMKPGDGEGTGGHSSISYQYTFSNTGSLPGKPWVRIENLVSDDNDCNEPETQAPDTSCGAGEGELSQNLFMKVNAPGNTGFVYLNLASCSPGMKCPLTDWNGRTLGFTGEVWEQVPAGGSTAPMVLEFEVPSTVGNVIQSDNASFDLVFGLDQV